MKSPLALSELKEKWTSLTSTTGLSEESSCELLAAALDALERAYAPYSSFKVGAAVLTEDGQIFTGCNVENASYGATVCAERVAVFKAVSAGHQSIRAVAVMADHPEPVFPCGICRQVIAEFASDALVLASNTIGAVKMERLKTLLPRTFGRQKTED